MTETLITISLLAIALSMDAFAIAITLGMSGLAKTIKEQVKIGFTFGFFQGGLFMLGYWTLSLIGDKFTRFNNLIAALLLAFLGTKMLLDSFSKPEEKCQSEECLNCRKNKCINTGEYRYLTAKLLLFYGTATALDAFAAGVSYGLVKNNTISAGIIIGITTFVFSFFGAKCGMYLKQYIGKKATILGGIILIILGIKSLF